MPELPSDILMKIALLYMNGAGPTRRAKVSRLSLISKAWRGTAAAVLLYTSEFKPVALIPSCRYLEECPSLRKHLLELRLVTKYESVQPPEIQREIANSVSAFLSFATLLKDMSISTFDVGPKGQRIILPALQKLRNVESLHMILHCLVMVVCPTLVVEKPEDIKELSEPISVEENKTKGLSSEETLSSVKEEWEVPLLETFSWLRGLFVACYPGKRQRKALVSPSSATLLPEAGEPESEHAGCLDTFQESEKEDVPLEHEMLYVPTDTWCPGLQQLSLLNVKLASSELKRFIPLPSKGLTTIELDNVSGATNSDLFDFLSEITESLQNLSIRRSIFPVTSEGEKYALDEVMPLIAQLKEAHLITCDLTCAALACRSRKMEEGWAARIGELKLVMKGEAFKEAWGGLADVLSASNWRCISIHWGKNSEVWEEMKTKALAVASSRGIELDI